MAANPLHVVRRHGCLSRYNLPLRWVMKRISRKKGLPTDTSRDYDNTDWAAVERFARDIAALCRPSTASLAPSPLPTSQTRTVGAPAEEPGVPGPVW